MEAKSILAKSILVGDFQKLTIMSQRLYFDKCSNVQFKDKTPVPISITLPFKYCVNRKLSKIDKTVTRMSLRLFIAYWRNFVSTTLINDTQELPFIKNL